MKRQIVLISFMLILSVTALGGGFKLNIQSGIGSYAMTDLKLLNNRMYSFITLPGKQVENFPMYWFYQGSVFFPITEYFSFGPSYTYQSTGSRYSLSDYSGEYLMDDLVNSHSLGLTFNYMRPTNFHFIWGIYTDGGVTFSNLNLEEKLSLTVTEESTTTQITAKAHSYFIEPGLCVSYPVYFFEPGFRIGYYFPIARSAFNGNSSDEYYLSGDNGIKSGWNGIRISLSVTIKIK